MSLDESFRRAERLAAQGDPRAKIETKAHRRRTHDPMSVRTHEEHRSGGRKTKNKWGAGRARPALPRGILGKGPGDVLERVDFDAIRLLCWGGAFGPRLRNKHDSRYIEHRFPTHLRFSERRDSWACVACDRWLETRCVHPLCGRCPGRPRKPSEDGVA